MSTGFKYLKGGVNTDLSAVFAPIDNPTFTTAAFCPTPTTTETNKTRVATIEFVDKYLQSKLSNYATLEYVQKYSPGAYLINTGGGVMPVFKGINNFNDVGFNDCTDMIMVLPKYKVWLYESIGDGEPAEYDNTGNTTILISTTTVNSASALRIFYNNTELTGFNQM